MLASTGDGGGSNTRRIHLGFCPRGRPIHDFLPIALEQTKVGPRRSGTILQNMPILIIIL